MQMIRHFAVLTLEHLLAGVDDDFQDIFQNVKKTEELGYENEQTTTTKEGEESIKLNASNAAGSNKDSEGDSCNNEAAYTEESKVVGKTKTVHTTNLRVLTPRGKRLVNSMLDQAQAKNLDELSYNERENYLGFLNPNINFFKVLDVKGKVYYNNDAKLYRPETGLIMEFNQYELDNIDWFTDENGDIYQPMSSQEYNDTWKMIMDVSKVEGMSTSIVNRKLTKEDKVMNDINVGYYNGKLCRIFGTTPTYDEKVLATIVQPEWTIGYNQFLQPVDEVPQLSDLLYKRWLCTPIGTKSNQNSGGKSRGGGKFARLNSKNKAKNKPQPENDAKAVAHNPTAQGDN